MSIPVKGNISTRSRTRERRMGAYTSQSLYGPTDAAGLPRNWQAGDSLMFLSPDGKTQTLEQIDSIAKNWVRFAGVTDRFETPIDIQSHLSMRCDFVPEDLATDMRYSTASYRPDFYTTEVRKTVQDLHHDQDERRAMQQASDELVASAILDAETELETRQILAVAAKTFEGKPNGKQHAGFMAALSALYPYLLKAIAAKNAPVIQASEVIAKAQQNQVDITAVKFAALTDAIVRQEEMLMQLRETVQRMTASY